MLTPDLNEDSNSNTNVNLTARLAHSTSSNNNNNSKNGAAHCSSQLTDHHQLHQNQNENVTDLTACTLKRKNMIMDDQRGDSIDADSTSTTIKVQSQKASVKNGTCSLPTHENQIE